ncbi:MAG: Fic family protein [Gammaproteobacteria bacterium]
MKRVSGELIPQSTAGESFEAYLPAPLPPSPDLALDIELLASMDRANRALGRLDGLANALPETHLFIYQYVRKEAVLSSQIEGTQSSLSDLLIHEMDGVPGVPMDDVKEVSNYVAALSHGLERIREGFPLSLRLLREMHAVLLDSGRGAHATPGEFRRSQNWLGGTRPGNASFIPPPPQQLMECLDAFERYLHTPDNEMPALLKAGLVHVQFETIHPFLDGNGRLGRLLITLLLCAENILHEPLLYLSLYFKTHRSEYYEQLNRVRKTGDWEAWLKFFLSGVEETAQSAADTAKLALDLFAKDRELIRTQGRIAPSCLQLHEAMQTRPVLNIAEACELTGINRTSLGKCFGILRELGIVTELTQQKRNRYFAYLQYMDMLSEGTQPL